MIRETARIKEPVLVTRKGAWFEIANLIILLTTILSAKCEKGLI